VTLNPVATPDGRGVTWVELFFDLIFVFSVTQLVGLLHDGFTWLAVGQVAMAFWFVWFAWGQSRSLFFAITYVGVRGMGISIFIVAFWHDSDQIKAVTRFALLSLPGLVLVGFLVAMDCTGRGVRLSWLTWLDRTWRPTRAASRSTEITSASDTVCS
jgi:hypothetical protein